MRVIDYMTQHPEEVTRIKAKKNTDGELLPVIFTGTLEDFDSDNLNTLPLREIILQGTDPDGVPYIVADGEATVIHIWELMRDSDPETEVIVYKPLTRDPEAYEADKFERVFTGKLKDIKAPLSLEPISDKLHIGGGIFALYLFPERDPGQIARYLLEAESNNTELYELIRELKKLEPYQLHNFTQLLADKLVTGEWPDKL